MKRAERRAKTAQIKSKIWRDIISQLEVKEHRKYFYHNPTSEKYIQFIIRSNMKNEGKGRSWFCDCERCLEDKRFSGTKEKLRLEFEEQEFLENSHYLGDYIVYDDTDIA